LIVLVPRLEKFILASPPKFSRPAVKLPTAPDPIVARLILAVLNKRVIIGELVNSA
jgi:hypothetical protein